MISKALDTYFPKLAQMPELKAELISISKLFEFEELLQVIETLTLSNKDVRLLEYLKKEAKLKNTSTLKTTHQHIAHDLGSSREVISKLLKKIEHKEQIKLSQGSIQIL